MLCLRRALCREVDSRSKDCFQVQRNEADLIVPGFFADPHIFNAMRFVPLTMETSTVIWTGLFEADYISRRNPMARRTETHRQENLGNATIRYFKAMKQPFETSPTPYVKAFDAQTWMMLALSIIALAMFHTLEGSLLRQQKVKVKEIAENFLRVFQSLLQEASKNR